jgi:alkylation response protein AidB-like acyl-CoA dehydrogenase
VNFQHQSITTRPSASAFSAALMERSHTLAAVLSGAAEQADLSAEIASATWEALHRSGLPLAPYPPERGGEDLLAPERRRDLVAVLRLFGSADLSMARLFEGHVNAVALVRRYGTSAQVGALAHDVAEGAFAGVWGADDENGLRAERVGSQWRLAGGKILASGAGILTRPIVTGSTDAGQIMLLPRLERGTRADLSGWAAQGMRSTATGRVDFSGLMLDADQVLGQPGDFTRQPHFSGGAWRFCAVHLGAAERLVDLFRAHLITRGRGDDPYQLQRVAQCSAATTTATFWVEEAARKLADDTTEPHDTVAFVNLTRMVTERAALEVIEAVHRVVGLQGFIRPHPIERISRDLATYLRQPVPDLAMADAARVILASTCPTSALWTIDGAR